jgi:hypothetical protein
MKKTHSVCLGISLDDNIQSALEVEEDIYKDAFSEMRGEWGGKDNNELF